MMRTFVYYRMISFGCDHFVVEFLPLLLATGCDHFVVGSPPTTGVLTRKGS